MNGYLPAATPPPLAPQFLGESIAAWVKETFFFQFTHRVKTHLGENIAPC
jgi:hypothetical protein